MNMPMHMSACLWGRCPAAQVIPFELMIGVTEGDINGLELFRMVRLLRYYQIVVFTAKILVIVDPPGEIAALLPTCQLSQPTLF